MSVKVGINGFGRIGRLVLRGILERPGIEVVGINDLFPADVLAHLFKYDSVHGTYKGDVKATDGAIEIDGKTISMSAEKDPSNLGWGDKGADIVVESTGIFRDRESVSKHFQAGAKKVIISAPATDPDITICIGVNEKEYDASKHNIISNASCTTNCLAPVAKVLRDSFGIKHGLMTTIHSYTNDQKILDLAHKDLRRSRAAAMSMIPTKTGAAAALGLVIPELKGKLDGLSVRVPTPNVSLVDVVVETEKKTTKEEVLAVFKTAAQGELKGILDVCEEPLVSIDFNHSEFSSIVDAGTLRVADDTMVKVLAWYDNEWGYSTRVVDLIEMV